MSPRTAVDAWCFWVLGAGSDDDTELAAVGLHPARDLYEMRVALPLAETAKFPADVRVRPFEIGRDETAWIEVNNRAFAGHDEQGGWTDATLRRQDRGTLVRSGAVPVGVRRRRARSASTG